jgi:rhodanese-related sulfurtransferase
VLDQAESVEGLLSSARSQLVRLSPAEAFEAARNGSLIVDIRTEAQQVRDGEIPCASVVSRNILEWRLDPASEHRDPALARRDRQLILICDEGYQSSLAAATVRRFGVDATDVVGGFRAWRESGLPVDPGASP